MMQFEQLRQRATPAGSPIDPSQQAESQSVHPEQPGEHELAEQPALTLYAPLQHAPRFGRGYDGAVPFPTTPLCAPYEPSFLSFPEFPGRRFWTWGMFARLDQADDAVIAELRATGWEPWNDDTRNLFFLLASHFAQTLIVSELDGHHRYWARTAAIEHAHKSPVLLTYESEDEGEYPEDVPAEMVIGSCALIGEGSSLRLYHMDQLGEEGRALCTRIREGMLLYPPQANPSAEERRVAAEERRSRWVQTHRAAQQLAASYWTLHQRMTGQRSLPAVPLVVDRGAYIASSLPVQAAIAAFSNAQSGAGQWSIHKHLPTYVYHKDEGTTSIQVRPYDEAAVNPATIQSLWEQVRQLSDTDGDVLLTMIAQAIATQQDEKGGTWITGKAILDYRGIKPIVKKERGRLRRAGHRQEDLMEVAACVGRMSNTWITVAQWIEDDMTQEQPKRRAKKSKKYRYTRDSRLIVITDVIHQQELLRPGEAPVATERRGERPLLPVAWRYQLGSWLDPFLRGANRQVAWLLQQVLSYDPYHQMWEKRLGRYVTFHMRMSLPQGSASIAREIGALVEELSLPINQRDPEKTRQRLEKALNTLVSDGIISSWSYAADNPRLPSRRWLETWLRGSIQVSAEVMPERLLHEKEQEA